jgi:predicted component of viral defense system (DUF524 family)
MSNYKTLKIQKTFQNWSKILELQKPFATHKLGKIIIIFKDKTLNLQGIKTLSKIHTYSKMMKRKICQYLDNYKNLLTSCKENVPKFIHMKKKLGKKTWSLFF